MMSGEALEALRVSLSAYLRSPSETEGLREAIRAAAAEARERRVLPEQLLVALKQVWSSLPEVRAIRDPAEHAKLLQRAVTICIGEYYR
jgi:DNA-binding NarL/FixJ family response regulator